MQPVTFTMPTKGLKQGAIGMLVVGVAGLVAAPVTGQTAFYVLGALFLLCGGGALALVTKLKAPVLALADDHIVYQGVRWESAEVTVGPMESRKTQPRVKQIVFDVVLQRPGAPSKTVTFPQLNWPELARMHELLLLLVHDKPKHEAERSP